tara:strand:- start:2629 stop:3816 length:1188 start_codon:yes stop_codon:yes gene_type:complete
MIFFKKLFRHHKLLIIQLVFFMIVALSAPFLANEKPLIAGNNEETTFPIFEKGIFLSEKEFDWIVMPIIPYSQNTLDYNNTHSIGPFSKQDVKNLRYRHWLGTDELGRDILSGIIHGARTALLVGLGSMLIATIIGIILGASAGFWGDFTIKIRPITFVTVPIGILIGYFLGFHQSLYRSEFSIIQFLANQTFNLLVLITFILLSILLGQYLSRKLFYERKYNLPLDAIVSRIIELAKSLPSLFLILSLAAILEPSIWNIIWIIGVITWTGIARYCRAEVIKQKNTPYTESVKALGFNNFYILLKHILPVTLQASTVYIVFGISGAILAESTLSFIGIGIQADEVSWGSILAEARKSPSSWWLAVFPGAAIFYTLMLFNKLAVAIENQNGNNYTS